MKGFDHGLFNFPELSVHRVNGICSPRKLLLLWAEGEKNLVYSILQLGSFVQWASTMVCYIHNRYYAMLLQPCLLVILPFELTMSLKMMSMIVHWSLDSRTVWVCHIFYQPSPSSLIAVNSKLLERGFVSLIRTLALGNACSRSEDSWFAFRLYTCQDLLQWYIIQERRWVE